MPKPREYDVTGRKSLLMARAEGGAKGVVHIMD